MFVCLQMIVSVVNNETLARQAKAKDGGQSNALVVGFTLAVRETSSCTPETRTVNNYSTCTNIRYDVCTAFFFRLLLTLDLV